VLYSLGLERLGLETVSRRFLNVSVLGVVSVSASYVSLTTLQKYEIAVKDIIFVQFK